MRDRKVRLGFAALVLLSLMANTAAFAQGAGPGAKKRPAPDPAAAQAALHADAARGLNDVTTPSDKVRAALDQMRMVQCGPAVQRITDFLFEGQDANFIAQPLGPDNTQWPTVFTIEVADPNHGHSHFAILMIAGNCSGMYAETRYWPQPCDSVKSLVFSKYVGDQVLQSQVRVSTDGPARQVFLTAAGTGCISVKKELFH